MKRKGIHLFMHKKNKDLKEKKGSRSKKVVMKIEKKEFTYLDQDCQIIGSIQNHHLFTLKDDTFPKPIYTIDSDMYKTILDTYRKDHRPIKTSDLK